MRSMRAFFALSSAVLLTLVLAGTALGADRNRVLAVEFSNDINPVSEGYL